MRPWKKVVIAALVAAAWIGLLVLVSGCASPARHKITPASTKILEIDVPAAPEPIGFAHPLHAVLVACALAQAQPERPETMAEVEIDGRTVRVPSGTKLRYIESTGAGLDSTSDEIAADWNAGAPTSATAGSAASGGALASVVRLTRAAGQPGAVLIVLGGLLLAGGVVAGIMGAGWKLGGALALAGVACLAAGWLMAQAPWMLAIAAVGVLGAVGYVVWQGRAARGDAWSLEAVTAAVDDLPAGTREFATGEVKKRMRAMGAEDRLRARVKAAKRRAGVV